MRWRLVLLLSLFGLGVGVLSLFGLWPTWAEFLVWAVVGAAWVTILHFQVDERFFLHGALTAFTGGMLGILTQIVFMPTYLANNPSVAQGFEGTGIQQARLVFLGTGLVVSLVYGAVTGLALWLTFPSAVRAALRRARPAKD